MVVLRQMQMHARIQMLTAPAGLRGPGRYNNPGCSYYYFADTLEGTIAELRKHDKKKRIQTAEVRPVKKITMIDLSGDTSKREDVFAASPVSI